MKIFLLPMYLLLCLSGAFGADTPVDLSLTDGSRIRGKVMSSNGSEVTVMSDIGVLRIAIEKLTPESRQSIEQMTKPDTASLLKRIAELEGKVAQLQQENEALRRQSVASPSPAYKPSSLQSLTPSGSTSKPTAEASHTISSTGKRHNSGCRYFGSGRSCGPTDGIACKICGG